MKTLVVSFQWAMIALLMGMFIDTLVVAFRRRSEQAEGYERHQQILQAIDSSFSVQKVGGHTRAYGELMKKVRDASNVKNTFLNIGGAPSPDGPTEAEICEGYHAVLSKPGNSWHDIVSLNELFSFRHERLNFDRVPPGTHRICVIRANMPIINFVLLAYDGGPYSEVYFGWLYDTNNNPMMIYRSADPEIIRMFDSYYDVLWKTKRIQEFIVDYGRSPGERTDPALLDRKGVWVSAALLNGKIVNYGVLAIDFVSDQPAVSGMLFDESGLELESFTSTEATYNPRRIYYEYKKDIRPGSRRGFCMYEFYRRSEDRCLGGFMFEDDGGPRLTLIGIKVAFDPGKPLAFQVDGPELVENARGKLDRLIKDSLPTAARRAPVPSKARRANRKVDPR